MFLLQNGDSGEEIPRRYTIAERRKVAGIKRVKNSLKRSQWKILIAGLLFASLTYISSIPNVGYSGSAEVDIYSAEPIVENHPCLGYVFDGYINVSLNPFLYPISCLMGQGEISDEFVRRSPSTYPKILARPSAAAMVTEDVMIGAWFSEWVWNLPYICFICAITAILVGRFSEKLKRHARSQNSE